MTKRIFPKEMEFDEALNRIVKANNKDLPKNSPQEVPKKKQNPQK